MGNEAQLGFYPIQRWKRTTKTTIFHKEWTQWGVRKDINSLLKVDNSYREGNITPKDEDIQRKWGKHHQGKEKMDVNLLIHDIYACMHAMFMLTKTDKTDTCGT